VRGGSAAKTFVGNVVQFQLLDLFQELLRENARYPSPVRVKALGQLCQCLAVAAPLEDFFSHRFIVGAVFLRQNGMRMARMISAIRPTVAGASPRFRNGTFSLVVAGIGRGLPARPLSTSG